MISFGIPYPDALRAGNKDVSVLIHLHPVRYAVVFAARLLPEDAAVRQSPIMRNVVDANISLFAVVDVEVLAVR